MPLTWPTGVLSYYTDQGNLSPILLGPNADAFVSNAFGAWNAISTAAIFVSQQGHLAEDVSSANFTVMNGVITGPGDITPTSTSAPIAVVYDEDGSVTDALLGSGASNPAYCASNSTFGGIDNFGVDAHFQHALIIINGNCAQSSPQLPDLQYHLVRIVGRVLGLDWSQADLNVITRNPAPSAGDYAGFPVMHESDPVSCVPVSLCYSNRGTVNPAQPKMDDQAALSRLYPITAQNVGGFPGKQVFAQTTARIHGNVFFVGANGMPAQPMQGVNVVARWIDPSNGLPSRSAVVTSVSGFQFCGNAGNLISGFTDSSGQSFNRFGSDDASLEGTFDLAGLQIPNGVTSAQYQLSVEGLDPLWSTNVGPYASAGQVQPSGSFTPIIVNVNLGANIAQDILMQGSALQTPQWYGKTSYALPAQLPRSGAWSGLLSGYGAADFFQFPAQTNRTLSVIVSGLDEFGNVSEGKAMPVAGMWALSDPGLTPAPANTASAFNTSYFAETRLDAQILQATTFRLGIADYRGDGRPDYHYSARVLYGDSMAPARASVAGGTPVTVSGYGLMANTQVQTSGVSIPVMISTSNRMLLSTPHLTDGVYDLLLSEANTGASSTMTGVLTVGAGPNDSIKMLSGTNPPTPVGGQAPSSFAVQVVAADGITPIPGATVQFIAQPTVAFSACGGSTNCTVLTDQTGVASTYMTVLSAGTAIVTAKLAPASYPVPQQVQTSLTGVQSALDLSLFTPSVWIAQGATVTLPLQARVLSNGSPFSARTVSYQISSGTGTLSAPTAQTDTNGFASVNLLVNSVAANVQVNICVSPSNNPCQTFIATMVPAASLQLAPVSGTTQIIPLGQSFQSVVVRVTDSASPPHPVLGAAVAFQTLLGRLPANQPIIWTGEAGISQPSMPVILAKSQNTVQSDVNGLATIVPSNGGASGNVAVAGPASVGNASVQFIAQQLGP